MHNFGPDSSPFSPDHSGFNFYMHQNYGENPLKHSCWVPPPQSPLVSGSVSLGWGPRMCIFNMFPGDAVATGLGTTHF